MNDIQRQDATNIKNIDRGKARWSGDQNKQVKLMQSKIKHLARLDKTFHVVIYINENQIGRLIFLT